MPEMDRSNPIQTETISDGFYSLDDNGVRCYLFTGSERALLVDTGFGQAGSLKAVVESLTDKPLTLVNTHGDPDHIGKNEEFGTTYMHPSEMAYYAKNATPGMKVMPLWEGDVIDLGGISLEVVLIPGHTPGSIALLDRSRRMIFTGDSISKGPVFMIGEGSDMHAYMASMEKLLSLADTFDVIYPAHGPMPISPDHINKELTAAKKLVAGEIPPQEPPFPLPAKMYMHDGAGFFF